MPKCTQRRIDFGRLGRRVIEADFSGGDLSSDGGVLLLRQVDRHIGLSRAAAAALPDPRDPARIVHGLRELLAQRIYGLCCGYEDLNDHQALRGEVLIAQFIASHQSAPEELVLDIDASDVPLHGGQELAQFHAYYDHHCYLPLYVFCGQAMLACVLRPSKIDGARHAAAVIKLLVGRLRRAWPKTRLIVRADSGFCRRRLLQWCERSAVGYIIGLARNARLHEAVQYVEAAMADDYMASGVKQRLIDEFTYAARSWSRERRVITRLEYGAQGTNPRFIVTNLQGDAVQLYDRLYCQRGEAENRIKEAQLDLFGTRASCHRFAANQLRLLLAALAYTLMVRLRQLALEATELERATAATIRWRLLKIGAAIVRNTRRVRVMLASHHPLRGLFATAAARLAALGP